MIDVLCGGLEWSAGMRVGGGQRIFPVACLSSRFLFRYPGQNTSLCEWRKGHGSRLLDGLQGVLPAKS